ncbi:odorant receptor 43b [Drosophila tropicalis]|uniref:odorant receptor 43b n=1 Tax=Drosophila tropicalis TaxID=46794 RepID=UPI0035AC0351
MLFKRIYPNPLTVATSSRESNAYMMDTLKISGLNLHNDFGYGKKIWRVISFSYGMVYLPLSFLLNYIIHIEDFSASTLLQSLQLCLNTWCFALKYFTLAFYVKNLEEANKCFDQLDVFCRTKEEQREIRKMVASCNKLYMIFAVVFFVYSTASLVDGLVHGRMPFDTYYPFINWRLSRTQFVVQAFVEFTSVGYAVFVATSTDSYAVIFVKALRSHVKLLTRRLQNMPSETTAAQDENFMHASLVDCIKAHKVLLAFCNTIRPLISGTIFAQFIICGSILGITTINLLAFAEPSARFGIIFYMMAVILQTFPLCYYCNAIVDDCNEMCDALFHSPWIERDQRFRKTTLQFLHKLQEPIVFTAMNIFSINLATNINVAKFAFTVYAIAKGMNLDEKLQQ